MTIYGNKRHNNLTLFQLSNMFPATAPPEIAKLTSPSTANLRPVLSKFESAVVFML